ncbi:sterile alpha motif domain-containing protein 3-like isoform X3 [Apostichopus japonicus]|uniref:sterile alpha motif domain-containing protein 3-like isoform X3 n=1 Tax=Stichopus japonicus TaxID=307972 RepID=UPI003AB39DE9
MDGACSSDTMDFLVCYGEDTFVIKVGSSDELLSSIRQKFSISESIQLKLKVYNNDWNEWVNISLHELKGKEKLKVFTDTLPGLDVFEIPWTSPVTGSSAESSFLDSDVAEALEGGDDLSSEISSPSTSHQEMDQLLSQQLPSTPQAATQQEVEHPSSIEKNVSSAALKPMRSIGSSSFTLQRREIPLKPWPSKFEIPVTSMSHTLRCSLEKGIFPNERLRRQLIQVLYDKMTEYERYPTKRQYDDVACALVETFPHLAHNIPCAKPYDFWKVKLSDKFRNERKHLLGAALPARKKIKISPSGHTLMNADETKGLGEDERSVEMHQKFMKQELLKKKINMAKVRELMDVTFWHRRKSIIETRLMVSNLLEKYPALKDYQELQREFQRITASETPISSLKTNMQTMAKDIRRVMLTKKKEKVIQLNLQDIVSSDPAREKDLEITSAVFLLPYLFSKSSSLINHYEKRNDIQDASPCLLWEGDSPLAATSLAIMAEGEIFGRSSNAMEALATLIATYWVFDMAYPKQDKDFFNFCEVALLKLTSVQPTRQTSNMLIKLRC